MSKEPILRHSAPFYPLFPSCRLIVYLMLCLGFAIANGALGNIGFAITCMTVQTEQNITYTGSIPDECRRRINESRDAPGPRPDYDWSTQMQGYILSGSAWGATAVTLLGWLPDKYGAKVVFFVGFLVSALANFLCPVVAKVPEALVLVRIVQGFGSGTIWSILGYTVMVWASDREYGLVPAIATSGLSLGSVINLLAAGKMCETVGWQYIFYMWGGACTVYAFLWLFLYSDDPEQYLLPISNEEVVFIKSGKTPRTKKIIPWKNILTSKQPWIIAYMGLSVSFYFFFLMDYFPTYLRNVLFLPSDISGVFAAICPLVQIFGRLSSGIISDRINFISTTTSVKLFSIMTTLFPAIFILSVTTFDCTNVAGAVTCIAVGFFFLAFAPAGFIKSMVYLAPSYTSTISMFNAVAQNLGGIIIALVLPRIMPDYSRQQYKYSMYFVAAGLILATLLYGLFGSAEALSWGTEVYDPTGNREQLEEEDKSKTDKTVIEKF